MTGRLEIVRNKYLIYKDLSSQRRDEYGWNIDDKCDGLLFNCLWSLAGVDVEIEIAKDLFGGWHRHPSMNCYEGRQSGSSISRDMLVGLTLWAIANSRYDIIIGLIEYGEENHWIMGKGDPSRTFMTPSLRSTLYECRYLATGIDAFMRKVPRDWEKPFPMAMATSPKGYSRHLQMLHILALSFLRQPTDRDLAVAGYHCKAQPRNGLYHAIHYRLGNRNSLDLSIDCLLDVAKFPQDSLPTNKNFRTSYLYQRDQEEDSWKPSLAEETHSGIEFLFTSALILGVI